MIKKFSFSEFGAAINDWWSNITFENLLFSFFKKFSKSGGYTKNPLKQDVKRAFEFQLNRFPFIPL